MQIAPHSAVVGDTWSAPFTPCQVVSLAVNGCAQVRTLTVEVLLPALCLVPANAGLVADVWAVLGLHSYTDRWRMYAALRVRSGPGPFPD